MESNNINIYKATKEDAQKIKYLRCKLVEENPRAFGDTPQSEVAKTIVEYENWAKEYTDNNGCFFLLEVNGKLIGMGAIKQEADNVAYMGSLGVLKDYQGKGYGRLLIAKRLEFAKQQNYKKIKTITTKENIRMLNILKKYGFIITGEGEYKGIPEYYLELKL